MKKYVNQLFVLVLVWSLVGCNKTELVTVATEKEPEQYAIPVLFADSKEITNGILVGSKSELFDVIKSENLGIVKSASNVNKVFIPTGTVGPRPKDPVDPSNGCWDHIFAIYEMLYPEALAVANAHCRDVLLCIGCPDGLTATMVVKPNSIKCITILTAEAQVSLFNVSGGFDGGKVTDYITQSSNRR